MGIPPSTGSGRRLPGELSSFVGRAGELESVAQALAGSRLLTLVGPGGCGKTRLAIRAARKAGPADVVWVDLSEEGRDEQVVARVAEAVAAPVPGSDPTAVAAALADRPALIVIDNCEQVRAGVAAFAETALRRHPDLTVLATSREPLGVTGERVWRLAPMILDEAIALFLDRAGADPEDPDARAAARRICDRLDRLPLALELAASWSGTLSLQEISELLIKESGHPLLDGDGRSAPFRQRTLAESFAWSHRLLTEDERVLLRRLAPFQQFGVETVRALAEGTGRTAEDQLRALRSLIDKSLVVCDPTGPRARHHLLTIIGEYALARLREAGEEEELRHRHARIVADQLAALAPLLITDKDAWRDRVRDLRADLVAAAEWCLTRRTRTEPVEVPSQTGPRPLRQAQDDASTGSGNVSDTIQLGRQLCADAAWWWHLTGDRSGLRLLQRAAELNPGTDGALQARVLVGLALVGDVVDPGVGYPSAERALALAEAAGDRATVGLARQLMAIGRIGFDLAAARELAYLGHQEGAASGDLFARDAGGVLVGLVHSLLDQHREAIDWLSRSVPGLVDRGDRGIAGTGLCALALSQAAVGDLAAAEQAARRAREVTEPLHDFARVGVATWGLARILALRGGLAEAEALLDELQRLIDRAEEEPYLPGWYATRARIALWGGDPAAATGWCERERFAATPDLLIVQAAARRTAGDHDGAAALLDRAQDSPILAAMPAIRAELIFERARLREADDPVGAASAHREALRLRSEHGLVLGQVDSLEALAALAGTPDRAAIRYGAADRARTDTGYRAGRPELPRGEEFAAGLDRGRALTLEQAVERALRVRSADRATSGWASLTPAERSVVDLAVRGLSNPEIAAELFIGRGTVKTHLAHVYAKLGVANRTELARSAGESGP
ncbi:helix-turn-helix transcriptional regulator [Microlunatus parietis]|uniref:Putative ATPase/DNA-binding CsgD family transcriptional regulator n=1 Tax=Microlunatus parietis TaxID=682979 RepID=A0A7Y9LC80_9ACTN|nr:LuxR C-terminal-related transcriptional regulator [Microlunatus parietis]NYE72542.1 putative ATPase/DNA-binding CsgD family transcriptional regulator [Microlunatus parietis]